MPAALSARQSQSSLSSVTDASPQKGRLRASRFNLVPLISRSAEETAPVSSTPSIVPAMRWRPAAIAAVPTRRPSHDAEDEGWALDAWLVPVAKSKALAPHDPDTLSRRPTYTRLYSPNGRTAVHLPPPAVVSVPDEARAKWIECRGVELEPALRSGAVALLDAAWLRKQAARGGILKPRQAIPYEAYISLDELIAATDEYGIHLICLSYPWLTPQHPDPRGDTVRTVARLLRWFIDGDGGTDPEPLRWGVFWDFASLMQHPNPEDSADMRTPPEERFFKEGLGNLAMFYSHPHTYVVRVTEFPPLYPYPPPYELKNGIAGVRKYDERGCAIASRSVERAGL